MSLSLSHIHKHTHTHKKYNKYTHKYTLPYIIQKASVPQGATVFRSSVEEIFTHNLGKYKKRCPTAFSWHIIMLSTDTPRYNPITILKKYSSIS